MLPRLCKGHRLEDVECLRAVGRGEDPLRAQCTKLDSRAVGLVARIKLENRMARMKAERRGLVSSYGRLWARNDQNFTKLGKLGDLRGVYVLYDGSMPVYVGRGIILTQLKGHRASKRRRRFWDYFSWCEIPDEALRNDTEALLIRTLPYYLRLLNKKIEGFVGPEKSLKQSRDRIPEAVDKPKFVKVKKLVDGNLTNIMTGTGTVAMAALDI